MRRFINFANAANFARSRSGLIPDLLLVKSGRLRRDDSRGATCHVIGAG
jgi:hypothetical protein